MIETILVKRDRNMDIPLFSRKLYHRRRAELYSNTKRKARNSRFQMCDYIMIEESGVCHQVQMEREWIIELTEEVKNRVEEPEQWKRRSIYKIPVHAANLNREAYTPWVVAIGPYHHEDEPLQRMEEHKNRALHHFLLRSKKPLSSYADALGEVVHDLMGAYLHLDESWKRDPKKFLQLMIVDGCFLLETIRADLQTIKNYPAGDLIFSYHGLLNVIPCIRRDMLLLENQLPLLVLQRLLAVESGNTQEQSEELVIKLILKFFGLKKASEDIGQCQHVLDVLRKSTIKEVPKKGPPSLKRREINEGPFYSATEMKQAGIKFERGSHNTLKVISFNGRTLTLPVLHLDYASESTLLNMVAYEKLHADARNEISFYIYFMNRLISDVRDVKLLRSHNIIFNSMASDDDVRNLFLSLSKQIFLYSDTWLDEDYTALHEKLRHHFKKKLFRWQYHLMILIDTYFRSPWTLISVMAAALALGLSIAQVVYAVLGFVHRSD